MCLCHPSKWPSFAQRMLVLHRLRAGEAMGEPMTFCEGDLDRQYQMAVVLLGIPGGPDRVEIRREDGRLVCAHDRAAA